MTTKYSGQFFVGTSKRKNRLSVGPSELKLGELENGETGFAYRFEGSGPGTIRAVLEAASDEVSDPKDQHRVSIERSLIAVPPDLFMEILIQGMSSGQLKLDSASASRLLAAVAIALDPQPTPVAAIGTGEPA